MISIKGWQVALVIGILGLLTLFYKGLWGDPRAIPPVLVGAPAPILTGPDLHSGEPVSLTDYRGKIIVINFWASWCLECRVEHENLLAIQKRFGGHPDFVMLGVDYQDLEEEALKYLKVYGDSYRHVRDLKGVISIDYGVYGVPETFVIDRQGIIRYKYIGPITGPAYTHITENIIEPLLQGRSLSTL